MNYKEAIKACLEGKEVEFTPSVQDNYWKKFVLDAAADKFFKFRLKPELPRFKVLYKIRDGTLIVSNSYYENEQEFRNTNEFSIGTGEMQFMQMLESTKCS